ncbi:unnamed protein product [Lampetra planeri]
MTWKAREEGSQASGKAKRQAQQQQRRRRRRGSAGGAGRPPAERPLPAALAPNRAGSFVRLCGSRCYASSLAHSRHPVPHPAESSHNFCRSQF